MRPAVEPCCPTCRARFEDLEEELVYLKSELALTVDAERLRRVRTSLGLTGQEARLVLALHSTPGRLLSKDQIEERLPPVSGGERAHTNTISVYVTKVRKKLGPAAIETVWGSGYRLGDAGRVLADQALGAAS